MGEKKERSETVRGVDAFDFYLHSVTDGDRPDDKAEMTECRVGRTNHRPRAMVSNSWPAMTTTRMS